MGGSGRAVSGEIPNALEVVGDVLFTNIMPCGMWEVVFLVLRASGNELKMSLCFNLKAVCRSLCNLQTLT